MRLLLFLALALQAQTADPGSRCSFWWENGWLRKAMGGSSFDFDLQRKILIRMTLDFDIAPPGKPFANYIHAALRKKGLKR